MTDLSPEAKRLVAEEAAYAASRGDTTTYSKLVDDVGGNVTEDRAKFVREVATTDAEHVAAQQPTRWPG